MSRRISLEDFDGAAPRPQAAPAHAPAPDIDIDALRSAAYEEGYKSGWDDCHAEQVKSEHAVSSDLAQSLKAIDRAYGEAKGDILNAIRPVIDAIIGQLLPKLATDGLNAMVAQELMPILETASDLEPEMICAPSVLPSLQHLVDQGPDLPVRLRADPAFAPAQVTLRLGVEAREIDLSQAVERIGSELDQFTERLIADISAPQD